MSAAELSQVVDRLITRVAHWQAGRWATVLPQPPDGASVSRADLLYALVQRFADLAAEADGEPRRTVPRLADVVLPDQFRVVADDLATSAAAPQLLKLAAEEADAVGRAL